MYSTFEVGLVAVIALLAGIVVGYLLLRYLGPRADGSSHDEARRLREEQQQYRHQVTQHFSTTAEMLGQLANSYREVHNHLAHGAQTLCDPEAVRAIKALPEERAGEGPQLAVEPPRDYAVKGEDFDSSGLDEEFRDPTPARSEPPRYL